MSKHKKPTIHEFYAGMHSRDRYDLIHVSFGLGSSSVLMFYYKPIPTIKFTHKCNHKRNLVALYKLNKIIK